MTTVRQGEVGATHRPGYLPALDGIRGIAIVWVVFHNATALPFTSSSAALSLILQLGHPGWIGVQLFFALSGYLITVGLLETRGSAGYFRNFYAKRALRILPLYYAVLFVLLIVAPQLASGRWPFPTHPQAALWLFVVNWTHTAPYGFAHFWSLAVEEQFYLVWPAVVYFCGPRPLLKVCLWISLAALVIRSLLVAFGADPWTLYTVTPCRMDALAVGAACACLLQVPTWREWVARRSGAIGAASGILFLAGAALTRLYNTDLWSGETVGYTLLAVSSAMLVLSVALPSVGRPNTLTRILSLAPLRSVGKYSYAMYVFHGLLHKLLGEPWLLADVGKEPPAGDLLLYSAIVFAASYALAYLSYHAFERHFLKLKRFFEVPRVSISASPAVR